MKTYKLMLSVLALVFLLDSCGGNRSVYGKKSRGLSKPASGEMMGR